jgi:probable F420-dependent oxidoreductase
VGEHIVLPLEEGDSHPYGKPGLVQPRSPNLEPFVQLAHLAGLTQRIRLATGVLILPIRNVFSTAREIATLDIVSEGRLDLGVGVGWHGGEFALMGADFASRGAHADEFLDALDQLLRERSPSFQGEHISFGPVGFEPKPVQTPRVPILVGGDSAPAMRRAALRGDGWYGHANSPEEGRARIETINRLLVENGRDPATFECILQVWEPPDLAAIEAYRAAGADRIVTCPFKPKAPGFDPIQTIEDYAHSIGLAPAAG